MAAVTPQYAESNLVGNISSALDAATTTITATFKDKVTGEQRTPQSNTKLFVIDKGSDTFPNPQYEIILAGSHSTTNGVTTLTSCVRGLAWYGTSVAGGTGTEHLANAEIGVVDVHYFWNLLVSCLDGTNSPSGFKLGTRPTFELAGVLGMRQFADATARDAAIASPSNGDIVYMNDSGQLYGYIGGSWIALASGGTFPNASETVAGKVELSTAAELRAGTSTGATGARLTPPNDLVYAYILPAGAILPYGGTSAPTGFLLCDGSAVSRATYADLFAVIGTAYGVGDGSTTFNLPNTKARALFGKNTSGTFQNMGATGGAETIDSSHTHASGTLKARIGSSTLSGSANLLFEDGGAYTYQATDYGMSLAASTAVIGSTANGRLSGMQGSTATGGSSTLSIQNPYLVTQFIIKT